MKLSSVCLFSAGGVIGSSFGLGQPSDTVLQGSSPFVPTRRVDVDAVFADAFAGASGGDFLAASAADVLANILPEYDFRVTDAYTTARNGVTHVYAQQLVNDVPVYNGVLNANFVRGAVSSLHDAFYLGDTAVSRVPVLSAARAVQSFAAVLGHRSEDMDVFAKEQPRHGDSARHMLLSVPNTVDQDGEVDASLTYVQTDRGKSLRLAWFLEVQTQLDYFYAVMDAGNGDMLSLANLVHRADGAYKALHIPLANPLGGPAFVKQLPTHDPGEGQPGWNAYPGHSFNDTRGNNCFAQEHWKGTWEDWENGRRPEGVPVNDTLLFDFDYDLTQDPHEYWEFSTVNLFSVVNEVHDILYAHGFDEVSGNFQMHNFGRGGLGEDAVIANAQDGMMMNNAMFYTPPDGQRGHMRMCLFAIPTPNRDSSLDTGVVIHEYSHGLNNRLTGGPSEVNCLRAPQAAGMDEGWGDALSLLLRMTEENTRSTVLGMGTYVMDQLDHDVGLRPRPFCLQDECNDGRFSDLASTDYQYPHAKGELWGNMMYESYWNLRDKHGFTADPYSLSGDKLLITLLIDGMKLQPCQPTFLEARDAILEADVINHAGDNRCELWCAYARRGMGVDAVSHDYHHAIDGYQVPEECTDKCADIYGNMFPFGPPRV